jgi:8-oxo-dGTP pyrophosphatase MutT (NUDIX family)
MTTCRFRIAHATAQFPAFDASFHRCILDAVDDALQRERRDRLAVALAFDAATPLLAVTVLLDEQQTEPNSDSVPLWHNIPCLVSADCNFRESALETATKKRRRLAKPKSIKLCACVLLERSDLAEPHVLLTRRNAQMRVSPGAFVVPGGHFDHGDDADIIACALRELKEETGIAASRDNAAIVAAFESVVPTAHFFICYVRVRAAAADIDLNRMLVPPKEVSQLVWLPRSRVAECIADNNNDDDDDDDDDSATPPADLDAFEVPSSKRTRQRIIERGCKLCSESHVCGAHLERCKLPVAALVGDEQNEGIASGTRMLLQHWFDHTS